MSDLIKFRVNDGQRIPSRRGGKPIVLVGGDIVEGPAWWAKEFAGRMTPQAAIGGAEGDAVAEAASTGRPLHEQQQMIAQAAADARKRADELDAQAKAIGARAEQESKARQAQRAGEREASGHPTGDPSVKVTSVKPDAAKS